MDEEGRGGVWGTILVNSLPTNEGGGREGGRDGAQNRGMCNLNVVNSLYRMCTHALMHTSLPQGS